jgi:hypothetical protein
VLVSFRELMSGQVEVWWTNQIMCWLTNYTHLGILELACSIGQVDQRHNFFLFGGKGPDSVRLANGFM